jgi:hypothetical protein
VCLAHREFATEHGIEVKPLLDELADDPSTAGLSPEDLRARLGALLMTAAEQRQAAIGGAA